ncbi:unnamed protein product, partial [Strongylus vulgaris]
MRPISLDGVEDSTPSSEGKSGEKAELVKDEQDFRHKRQVESRDCGLVDMANLIQPRGKIELGNPVFMQLVSGEGEQPVVQAKLGDILELRWEIMAMDDELDFFVKDCFA